MRKKKILASMLMAPMAFGAYADIQMDTPTDVAGWTNVSGASENLKWESNGVSCPVGISSISTPLTLQPGKYKLSFGQLTNAKVTVKIGETVLAETTAAGEVEFTVDGNKKVDAANAVITIVPVDNTLDYSYQTMALDLVFNFNEAQTALQAKLDAVAAPIELVDPEADKTTYEELVAKKTTIQGNIDKVGTEQTIDTYTEFALWGYDTEDTIDKAIEDLKTDIEAYNVDAAKANNLYNNDKNKTDLLADAADAQTKLDELKAAIGAVKDDETTEGVNEQEYVSNQTQEEIEAAQDAIDAYKAAVEAFYAEDPENPTKFEDSVLSFEDSEGLGAAMESTYTDAENAFDGAKDDIAAYNDFNKYVADKLTPAFQQAQTSIAGANTKALEGYTFRGVTDEDPSKIEVANQTVQKLYNDNKTLAVEGAAAKLADAKAAVDQAITDMGTTADDINTLVDEQNGLMGTLLNTIKTAEETIKAEVDKNIDNEDVNALITAAQEALKKLQTSSSTAYETLELPADTEADVTALNTALDNLKDGVQTFDDNTATINDLQAALDHEKTVINGGTEGDGETATEYPGYEQEVKDRMATTIANIQNSINALDVNDANLNVTDIEQGIKDLANTALNLNEALKTVKAGETAYADYLTEIESLKTDKLLLEGATAALGTTYDDFKKAAEKFTADKNAALGQEDDQACYAALKALADQWTNTDKATAETDATAIMQAFDKAGTVSNIDVVKAAKAALDKYVKGLTLNADATATVSDILAGYASEIAQAQTDLAAAVAADYDHAKYNAVDEALQALNRKISTFKTQLEAYIGFNMTTLSDLVAACNALNADYDGNKENGAVPTLEPAHSYWDNLLNGSDDKSYQSRIDALQAALDAALAATDAKDNVTSNKSEFEATYNSILTGLTDVQTNIPANEKSHGVLLKDSDNLRALIVGYIADIDARYDDVAGVNDLVDALDGYKAKLQALLDSHVQTDEEAYSNVAAVDSKVYNSYAIGNNSKQETEFSEAYLAIKNAAQAIALDFSDNFNDAIDAANTGWLSNVSWTQIIADLKAEYTKDVKAYNLYMYGLTNPTYKAMVQGKLANYAAIYDSNNEIVALQAAFKTYVEEQNKTHNAITEAEFKANALDKAQELLNKMQTRLANMEADVLAVAHEYYNTNEPDAVGKVDAAKQHLTAIGVTDEEIAAAAVASQVTALETAQNTNKPYFKEDGTFEQPTELDPYAYVMDAIANYLDAARADVNYNAAANNQWAQDIQDANTTIAEDKELKFDFASDDEKAAWEAAIKAAEDAIKELPATSDEDTLLGNQTALENILKALSDAKDTIDQASTNAKDAQEAYDQYTGDLADMNALADALREFVESLAAGKDGMLSPVDAAIKAYSDYIEANKNKLYQDAEKAEVERLAQAVQDDINAGYATAITAENTLLDSWIDPLKEAFNDAKVNAPLSDDQSAPYQKTINDLVETIKDMPVFTPDMTAEEYDAYKALAVETENSISNTYQELQSMWSKDDHGSDNPLPDPAGNANADITAAQNAAQAALDAYNSLLAEAEEYSEYFGDGAFDTFKSQAGEYAQELEAIAAAVEVEGNNVILTSDRYINDYNGVKSDIEGKTSDLQTALDNAKAAKEFQDKVNQGYDNYLAQIDDVQAEFDALQEKIAGYSESIQAMLEGYISTIGEKLTSARETLDLVKKKFPQFLANNTLQLTQLLDAKYLIDLTACQAAKLSINEPASAADAAVTAASDFLKNNNIVPAAAAALSKAISDARVAIEDLQNRKTAADAEKPMPSTEAEYLAIAEGYKTVMNDLEAVMTDAEANVFVPGDVAGAEGLTDGKVNSLDVQTLIDWVGQGITYQELYDENPVTACAADVMNDNLLNIGDITKVIRMAMGMDDSDQPAAVRGVEYGAGLMSLQVLSSANGLTTYAVNVNSQTHFIGGQLDLLIPAGCEIVDTRLVSGAHNLYRFDNAEGVRFVIASMENAELVLDGDCVMTVTVRGEAPIAPKAGTFADSRCFSHEMLVNGGNASGIEGIEDGDGSMMQQIYDAYGRTLRALKRGINIIRHSDGSVTKEYRK